MVERLCVLADLPKPAIVLDRQLQPNSWIEGTKRGGFRLHLTQGLLELLEPRELEAVIAHELAHVANRDAAVMTVVGGPGEALLSGGVRVAGQGWWPLVVGGAAATLIGWVGTVGTRALSRYREFAADEGAVRLTGSPAALASALMKVTEGLGAIPRRDLRAAGVNDAFHFLPALAERPVRAAGDAPAAWKPGSPGSSASNARCKSLVDSRTRHVQRGRPRPALRACRPSLSRPSGGSEAGTRSIGSELDSNPWPRRRHPSSRCRRVPALAPASAAQGR